MLVLIPTPIGNLGDMTLRAIDNLTTCDAIICEDTRRTGLLLQHFEIRKPMLILNDFNEAKNINKIIERLLEGQTLCLVSDAGTPLVSDPGYKLVRECLQRQIEIDSLPGATSITTALTLSGMPPDKFCFIGFMPDKPTKISQLCQNLAKASPYLTMTYIGFVSPYKLIKTLEVMAQEFGDIEVCLAKELTKIHQSVESRPISLWLEKLQKKAIKGEWIILFRLDALAERSVVQN